MAPTIKAGDEVFADPLYYKHSPVQRGDIVVVKDPEGRKSADGKQEELYIKRIIGLAGDRIQLTAGTVYVNGRVLNGFAGGQGESDAPIVDFGPIVVPPGEYFLVGDNLANSYDSRHWKHPVNMNGIYGKVTAIKDGKTNNVRYL